MARITLKEYSQAKVNELGEIIEVPEKTYVVAVVTARKLRRAFEIMSTVNEMNDLEANDEMIEYIVDVFNNQFTADDILDGILSEDFDEVIRDVMDQVTGAEKKKKRLKEKAMKAQN
ncbi:hypothetical protein J7I81_17795 [Bacillus sp. ISL-32]|uniref:phage tail assembly chaperone G n=1 Tax=Bacillus atrophaeus TaxID=1452 RepID=UPI001BEAACAF|nr:hypothetical protein [Bacillus atrophaeus]MBT2627180.1 hypothetical protein [Bacillus sp. ISL-32]MCG8395697.1 hypothetical protein [Bacillus atrophaeus]